MFHASLVVVLLLALHGPIAAAAEKTVSSATEAMKALATAQPGDVVLLADGVYRDFQLTINADCPPEKPLTIRAANAGKAILTGTASLTIAGHGIVVSGLTFDQVWRSGPVVAFRGATACRLTDCAFLECGNPNSTFGRAIEMAGGAQKNRVDHCYMQGNLSMGMGVKVAEPDNLDNTDNRFDHNYFRDIEHRSSNGQEAVQLGQGPAGDTAVRATVEFNLFERANGDPEVISNKTSHNVLRYNTLRECTHGELTLRGGRHVRVEGNFIFGGKGGLRVYGSDHQIVNNYIEGCRRGIILPYSGQGYEMASRCTVAFNTIVDCLDTGLGIDIAPPPRSDTSQPTLPAPRDLVIANNLLTGRRGKLVDAPVDNSHTWRQNIVWARDRATVARENQGIIRADPNLEQAGGLWRPAAVAKSVRGAAMPINGLVVSDDIDGQPRKDILDIGCDQASDTPILRRPLAPTDVGPTWIAGDSKVLKRIDNAQPVPPFKKSK